MAENFGATPAQWEHFSKKLGLTADLLPVVSKPTAKISAASTMKQLGKTPSRYNGSGEVVGIADWTSHLATPAEVKTWASKPDYGICIQTRTVRAFDIDCEDSNTVLAVVGTIETALGAVGYPVRYRGNSAKCLLIFKMPGDLPKRVIRMKEGIIELLATGQQFIACGTHPSGVKYEWMDAMGNDGLPESMPELTLEQVNHIWSTLEAKFAVAPSSTASAPSKAKVLHAAIENDPVAQFLISAGSVLTTDKDGRMHITCPFEAGHSTASAISSTTYFPANTGGYQFGHFDCKHASCEHRVDQDFKDALGMPYEDPFDDFDDLTLPLNSLGGTPQDNTQAPETKEAKLEKDKKPRFTVVSADDFAQAKPQMWIVKKVLPQAELGVIYGESTAGKSFFVLDLAACVARGVPWRSHHVAKGRVVYICAEGAGGMRGRLSAYGRSAGVELRDLDVGIIADAPNFMEVSEVKSVLQAIKAFGEVSIIIVDTFAQVMAGANENSGEDVGKALKHCKALHKHTGALVLLVHHAGKDTSKGARGWSGLRAAADVEIEIIRDGDDRVASVTKLKDGSDGADYGFKLQTVVLGVDEDMEEITSCVVEYTEGKRPQKAKRTNASSTETLVLKAMDDLLTVGTDSIALHDLTVHATNQMPFDETSGAKDKRGEQVSKAISLLRDSGRIVVVNGSWLKLPSNEEEELA